MYTYKYDSNNLQFYKYLTSLFPEIDHLPYEDGDELDSINNAITFGNMFDSLIFIVYESSVPDLCVGDDASIYLRNDYGSFTDGATYDIGECCEHLFLIEYFHNCENSVIIDLDEHWQNDKLFQLSTMYNMSDFIKLLSRLYENNLTFEEFIKKIWELYK